MCCMILVDQHFCSTRHGSEHPLAMESWALARRMSHSEWGSLPWPGGYPLVMTNRKLLKPWPSRNVVDLPSYKMVDLSSSLCGYVYQAGYPIQSQLKPY